MAEVLKQKPLAAPVKPTVLPKIEAFKEVPIPATHEQMHGSLHENKRPYINAHKNLGQELHGTKVGARLDIPAYRDHGIWVVSLHQPFKGGRAGKVLGYGSTSVLHNVVFNVNEKAAVNIKGGKPKSTIATMDGEYQNDTDEQAYEKAKHAHAMEGNDWIQVGMNPHRHSYFYNRKTEQPVTSAERVVQVGGLVMAYKPQYGEHKHFRFAKTQGLPFVNALTNSQSSNSEGIKKLAERVMLKGGFTGKYRVAKAVGSWRTGSGEGAVHVFHDQPDHAQLRYLASWAGMYTNSPSVLAFHGHDDGPDTLHYLDFPETDISKIRAGMRSAGITAKTMVPGPKSTRVFIYDQAGQSSALISAFGRANNAIIRQSRGTGTHIGSDAQDPDTARAKARQHYRKEITLYEAAKQANLGNPNAQLPISGGASASNGSGKKGGINAGSGNRAASPGSLVRGQYYKPGTFKPSMSYGSEGKGA